MKRQLNVDAYESELLAINPGKMEGRPGIVLTFRVKIDGQWRIINHFIEATQTKRLSDDLLQVLDKSEMISGAAEPVCPETPFYTHFEPKYDQ